MKAIKVGNRHIHFEALEKAQQGVQKISRESPDEWISIGEAADILIYSRGFMPTSRIRIQMQKIIIRISLKRQFTLLGKNGSKDTFEAIPLSILREAKGDFTTGEDACFLGLFVDQKRVFCALHIHAKDFLPLANRTLIANQKKVGGKSPENLQRNTDKNKVGRPSDNDKEKWLREFIKCQIDDLKQNKNNLRDDQIEKEFKKRTRYKLYLKYLERMGQIEHKYECSYYHQKKSDIFKNSTQS